ncbi:MAG: class I SAM-dependent methyltransferase [Symbiobacteriia bacterium]
MANQQAAPAATAQAFDHASGQYDQWYATPLGEAADRLEKGLLLGAAKPQRGEAALDLGAGTGQFSLELAAQGLHVTGVDISLGMLAQAEAKAKAAGLGCRFLHADAMHLPFPADSFDLVTAVTSLEFMPDPRAVLREAWRVLRPGGRLVAGAILQDSPWGEAYRQAAAAGDPVFSRACLFSRTELSALLSPAVPEMWEGLFIDPTAQPGSVAAALQMDDAARRESQRPGFLVVRWQKLGGPPPQSAAAPDNRTEDKWRSPTGPAVSV